MSDAQADGQQAVKNTVLASLAAFIGIPLLIFMLVKLFTSGPELDPGSPTMTKEAVAARIQPVGMAKLDESGPPGSRNGKAVYEAVCMSCHGAGLAGAPKFGDVAAWSGRLGQGFAKLVEHAVKGLNAMPAKGGAADLTDDEVARAVAYMGNAAGGKFTEPAVQAAGAAAAADPAVKGKEIYDTVCMACHATGAAGAPKFGDKAAWADRAKVGLDALAASASKGKNAMPPKGGYAGSDTEFRAAVEYMVNAAK